MPSPDPGALLPLPTEDDADHVCVTLSIPGDSESLSNFMGAIARLARWNSYRRDPDHRAVIVAQVWQQILADIETGACILPLTDVRQNEELPCTLEKTFDGDTWTAFANLQLCPPKLRTGANGGTEWWDGTGWVPLPDGGDERQDGGYTPPWPSPPGGQTGNCLAAENIVAIFDTSMLQGKVALDAGMIGFGIVSAIGTILSPFIPAAIFVTAASAIGGMIFNGGVDFLTDVTSTDNLDALKCAVDCKASADGSITAAQFNDIKGYVDDKITDATIRSLYDFWLDGLGPVGLSRMGAAGGITSGDCASCDCEPVSISYFWGSGPGAVTLGDEFTLNSDSNPYTCNIGINTGSNVKMTVVSVSGQVPYSPQSDAPGWRVMVGSTVIGQGVSGADVATDLPSTLCGGTFSFQGAAGHTFSVVCKFTDRC